MCVWRGGGCACRHFEHPVAYSKYTRLLTFENLEQAHRSHGLCVCVCERERERESVCVCVHTHTHTHTYIYRHADHIVPVFDGGGLCSVDNIRTLCVCCHALITRQQCRLRAGKLYLPYEQYRLRASAQGDTGSSTGDYA